jgi:hypothetical protein
VWRGRPRMADCMSWTEFLIRVFGWLAAVALFLGLRVMWQTWTAKRCKWISTYYAGEGARATKVSGR